MYLFIPFFLYLGISSHIHRKVGARTTIGTYPTLLLFSTCTNSKFCRSCGLLYIAAPGDAQKMRDRYKQKMLRRAGHYIYEATNYAHPPLLSLPRSNLQVF
jgi:hypothetical protein